jgi:glycosyltransferase involved in cell wall biosynthesis
MSLTVLMNAGPWLPVPPRGYGGIEAVVATLVPELRRQGVRVVLATVGASTLPADGYVRTLHEGRLSQVARPYNLVSGVAHAHMQAVVEFLRNTPGVDVVHDHLEVVGPAILGAMGEQAPPTLQTLHWDLAKHPDFYSSFRGHGRVAFAAVSRSQLDRAPENLRSQTVGVVPLAVPWPEELEVEPGPHALVLARITPDKAQDVALRVCREADVPLVLAGPVAGIDDPDELRHRLAAGDPSLTDHPDVEFFRSHVAPHLDGLRARWVGGVSGEAKERLLRSARALLTPIRWAEPGATAVVEALARGIPVVGTPLGVLPTLVQHGVTGYLAEDETELAGWLGKLDQIDPSACREAARQWTPSAMAARYVELYHRLLDGAAR